MKMTAEDINRVEELHDDIEDLLDGNDFSVCLHALCSCISAAGVISNSLLIKANRRASKQEFMASVHESISSWYDHYQDLVKGQQND
jgi:hypothetical protein